eukprot:2058058-Pyramimonas_sp.AAC.1
MCSPLSGAWSVAEHGSEEEKVPIRLPLPRFSFLGPPGRPSSPPLDSLRSPGQNAPQERSGE